MKKYTVLLLIVILGLMPSCKIVRAIGETIGVVDEKPKQEEVQPEKPENPANSEEDPNTLSSEGASKINLGKWLFWSAMLLSVAMGVRYAVLRSTTKNRK